MQICKRGNYNTFKLAKDTKISKISIGHPETQRGFPYGLTFSFAIASSLRFNTQRDKQNNLKNQLKYFVDLFETFAHLSPQHFLNLRALPQKQGSLRPTLGVALLAGL